MSRGRFLPALILPLRFPGELEKKSKGRQRLRPRRRSARKRKQGIKSVKEGRQWERDGGRFNGEEMKDHFELTCRLSAKYYAVGSFWVWLLRPKNNILPRFWIFGCDSRACRSPCLFSVEQLFCVPLSSKEIWILAKTDANRGFYFCKDLLFHISCMPKIFRKPA